MDPMKQAQQTVAIGMAIAASGGNPSDAIDIVQNMEQRRALGDGTTIQFGIRCTTPKGAEVLANAGVVFAGKRDHMVQTLVLPPGWTTKTEGYWTKILDELGRERAHGFYKGASHDYEAFYSVYGRYGLRDEYEGGEYVDRGTRRRTVASDGGAVTLFRPEGWGIGGKGREDQQAMCVAWLDEHFPNWQDVAAYW